MSSAQNIVKKFPSLSRHAVCVGIGRGWGGSCLASLRQILLVATRCLRSPYGSGQAIAAHPACLSKFKRRKVRLHSGRHDRQRWYTRGISGMAADRCSQERCSNESVKNGVTGNVTTATYRIRRFDNEVPVIPTRIPMCFIGMERRDLLKIIKAELKLIT
jgi:hypothetical protein